MEWRLSNLIANNIYNNIAKLKFNTKNVSSRGRKGNSCRTGLEGLGDSLEKGIPKFAAEGCNVSPVEEGFHSLYYCVLSEV